MGIMEDVTDLSLNHLRCRIRRQRLFIICIGEFIPIRPCKNGMFLILIQNILHKRVQNRLLALKMAVKRCLANADGACNLRDRCGFKALHGEQIQ